MRLDRRILIACLLLAISQTVAAQEPGALHIPKQGDSTVIRQRQDQPRTIVHPGQTAGGMASQPPFKLLGATVAPGDTRQLIWAASQNYAGMQIRTPVLVAHGRDFGQVLCVTAAIHGNEINVVEIVRRILSNVRVGELRGTLVGVPIVNKHGFQRNHRYLEDRRDLNQSFPGNPRGSFAARIAHAFFTEVVAHCDVLVDIHTGSGRHARLPQLRADMSHDSVATLVRGFGPTSVLNGTGLRGSLRRAATDAGVTTVTLEVGEPERLQVDQVEYGVKALTSAMFALGMTTEAVAWSAAQSIYEKSVHVRAPGSGLLITRVALGDEVQIGQIIATIVDPVANRVTAVRARHDGRVLGMALNQVVMSGFTVFRVGVGGDSTTNFSVTGDDTQLDGVDAEAVALVTLDIGASPAR